MRRLRNNLLGVMVLVSVLLGEGHSFAVEAPILRTSGFSPVYMSDALPVVIDPAVELYSPSGDNLTNVTVEIRDNYYSNQDVLQYTNPVTGISGTFNSTEGKLVLVGNTNAAAFQKAMRRVEYVNSRSLLTEGTRKIVFNAGDNGTYLSETHHFYEFIPSSGITWYDANVSATQMYYYGCQGYLMTVTSAAENAFAVSQLGGSRGWMGASDVESNKIWKWVCGPEEGLHFFTQTQNASGCGVGGTNVTGQYSNWDDGEPNDWNNGCEHNEDHAHFLADGTWNDYAYDNNAIEGFIVEYGGRTNDPALHFADEVNLQVQRENIAPGSPTLVSPVNCPDAGAGGPVGDSLELYGRTQNRRPRLIWQVPLDMDDNKLNFYLWCDAGDTNAGSQMFDSSVTQPSNFVYNYQGSWTGFPSGGVTNYNSAWVGYSPTTDVVSVYTDVYWKVYAYDGVTSSAASEVRRFLCGGRFWSDDPLPAEGRFRDDYINELRDEVDYTLLFRGMAVYSWTDADLIAGSTRIRDDHIMQLRTAVEQVVTNTGAGTALTNWTDHPIIPLITPMKRAHISELRSAVEGL